MRAIPSSGFFVSPVRQRQPKEPNIMKHRSNARRQGGFTLVEIAIVLMIVGLLIGGILRGQEMIQSARVRNIIDQKSAIQTAHIAFMDRFKALPGDLTATQATTVGDGAIATTLAGGNGDGIITWNNEGVLFFQNLAAAGFISCGPCMTVLVNGASSVSNSPTNVYGDFVNIGTLLGNAAGTNSWYDTTTTVTRLALTTGGTIPSQVLAEVDRKADDGLPQGGQLRFFAIGGANAAVCAPIVAPSLVPTWATPSQMNCQAAWLL
jgi:prepilin-type N-terminal cleavage/methylation domain-containing protein